MVIHRGASGLQDKDVLASHILTDFYLDFTIAERFYLGLAQPDPYVTANMPGQVRIRVSRKQNKTMHQSQPTLGTTSKL